MGHKQNVIPNGPLGTVKVTKDSPNVSAKVD